MRYYSYYLNDGMQVVKVNGVKSQPIVTNVGVPQGSMLGMLLFFLFLELHQDLIAFADNTVVPMKGTSWPV